MSDYKKRQHIATVEGLAGRQVFSWLPQGWQVTAEVPTGFWDLCNVFAFPLKATKWLWIFPTPASREYAKWVKAFGKEAIMVVAIPDDETMGHHDGYSYGPIVLTDLHSEHPQALLTESLRIRRSRPLLAEMKQRAAMMLLGLRDTK